MENKNIFAEQYLSIGPDFNIFINDIEMPGSDFYSLSETLKPTGVLFSPYKMSEWLVKQIDRNFSSSNDKIIVVNLGGGGSMTSDLLVRNSKINIADDFKLNSNSQLTQEIINYFLVNDRFSVLLVDDVVVSGNTALNTKNGLLYETALKVDSVDRNRRFTVNSKPTKTIDWYLASWMLFGSSRNVTNYQDQFKQIFTGLIYSGTDRQPPLNSLSGFVESSERAADITTSYSEKYSTTDRSFKDYINRYTKQK